MKGKAVEEQEETKPFISWLYDFLDDLIIYIAILFLILSFFFRVTTVSGISMQPSLYDGNRLLLFSAFYTPERGDIIVLSQPNGVTGEFDKNKIKRVIGVAGDEIDINYVNGRVYRNGEALYEPYLTDLINGPSSQYPMTFPLTVPEGQLFVLGDNRNNSLDSRDEQVGLVDERYVLGKAILRFWPPGKFKVFENYEPVEESAGEVESGVVSSEG